MSRFYSSKYATLTPSTPGEQPTVLNVTKLNTNECPCPPSEKAKAYALANTRPLNLYPELQCIELRTKLAEMHGVRPENIVLGNGSDELLDFAFMAFCDEKTPAAFADITYGFYPVFADLNFVPYTEIPLKEDFSIDPADYYGIGKNIFLDNTNAHTGMALSPAQIEGILKANPDNVVVVD